jgi:glycosyltransferase involved in cell wall biosynthesis
VPRLARATEAAGRHACPIVGFCSQDELQDLGEAERNAMKAFPPSRMRWMVDGSLHRELREMVRAADGVHIHGLWETHCMTAAGIAQSCRRPYMVSAHGMLEQWALRRKRLKKAFYAALIEIRVMRRAACLRALSLDEVDDYRRLGLNNPIAIVPGGVDVPSEAGPELFRATFPKLEGKRIVLFMGRIDQKKGLNMLLAAWAAVVERTSDIHLMIAGPDCGMLPSLLQMTDQLRLHDSVTFAGMVTGELKWSMLATASLFVLPSYSEGFSIAVLEAMAMAVPVIVTTPCHIPEVAIHDCGWVIQPQLEKLEQALGEFLALSGEKADEKGRHGRGLARTRFHSSVVAGQMDQVYEWLQGGAEPSSVEIV